MRGKRFLGAAALALALTAAIGGPAQAAQAEDDPFEIELVKRTVTSATLVDVWVECPVGKKVISGGYQSPMTPTVWGIGTAGRFYGVRLPLTDNPNLAGDPVTITVYAVCACADKVK